MGAAGTGLSCSIPASARLLLSAHREHPETSQDFKYELLEYQEGGFPETLVIAHQEPILKYPLTCPGAVLTPGHGGHPATARLWVGPSRLTPSPAFCMQVPMATRLQRLNI